MDSCFFLPQSGQQTDSPSPTPREKSLGGFWGLTILPESSIFPHHACDHANRNRDRLPGATPCLPLLRGRGDPFRTLTQRQGTLHGVRNGIFGGTLSGTDRTLARGYLPLPGPRREAISGARIRREDYGENFVWTTEETRLGSAGKVRFYNADKFPIVPGNHRYAGCRIVSCMGTLHPHGRQNKNYRHQWEKPDGNRYAPRGRHKPFGTAGPGCSSCQSFLFPAIWGLKVWTLSYSRHKTQYGKNTGPGGIYSLRAGLKVSISCINFS